MPPLFLFQTHRFFSSENTCSPAARSSPRCRQSMHTKAMAPSFDRAAACPSLLRHLASPHGELPVPHTAETTDMAVNRHVVGRVGEDQIGLFSLQEILEACRLTGIAAQQPMPAQYPQVSRPGHGCSRIGEGSDLIL